MKIEHKDFIGTYRGVYSDGFCQHLISEFDRMESNGAGSNRQQSENASKHVKDDYQINFNLKNHNLLPFNNEDTQELFFAGLQRCYDNYTALYSTLKNNGKIRCTTMKMPCTAPGGGYHVWHSEQGNESSANRVLVYILYLNTLAPNQAGETEFLYQQRRVSPEENMLLMWPAAFTHAHRGNVLYEGNSKYIVTGWFFFD